MRQNITAVTNHQSQQTFVLLKTSSRRLDQDKYIRLSHTSSEDVFKKSTWFISQEQYICLSHTFSRRLLHVFKTFCQDMFKTSLKILKTSSRHLQDVLQRRLQDVFKKYHQVKLFLLTCLRDIFNMFLRLTAKTVIYRRICLGHVSQKSTVSVQTLHEWKKLVKFSFSLCWTF